MVRLRVPWRHRGLSVIMRMETAGRENALPNCCPGSISPNLQLQKPMFIERIFLIGAGGHGMVVLDALERAEKKPDGIRIFDESTERIGQKILDLTVQRFDL